MASNAVVIDVPSSGALDRMVAVEDEPSHVAVRRAIDVYSERRERIERRGEERIFDDPVVLAIPQFTRDALRVLLVLTIPAKTRRRLASSRRRRSKMDRAVWSC